MAFGSLKCSSFSGIKEHSYRMETIWLFLTVLFAHSFKLFSCGQKKSIYISFHRSDTGKVLSPDHFSSNTMDTTDWFYSEVFICLDLHCTT